MIHPMIFESTTNLLLEAISKMQITLKDKARADEKAQSRQRRDEQYILRRSATP
jgi:hypothetical protein